MSPDLSHLHGQRLSHAAFDADTHEWVFTFTGRRVLQITAPWRIVSETDIVLGRDDDGQLFGLNTPVDAKERIARAVAGKEVTHMTVSKFGDLDVRFASSVSLQVFNDSCGYEGWQLFGPGEKWVVAQGGGRVVDSKQE